MKILQISPTPTFPPNVAWQICCCVEIDPPVRFICSKNSHFSFAHQPHHVFLRGFIICQSLAVNNTQLLREDVCPAKGAISRMVQAREDVDNLLCITSDYQETRGSQYEKIEISRIITKMLRALEMKRVFRGLE